MGLFKDDTNVLPYFVDAIIWVNENNEDDSFTGRIEDVASWQYIRKFPFTPKKFFIKYYMEKYDESKHKNYDDQIENIDGVKYIKMIKNKNKLKKVDKHYNMLEQLKTLNEKKYNKIIRKNKLNEIKKIY